MNNHESVIKIMIGFCLAFCALGIFVLILGVFDLFRGKNSFNDYRFGQAMYNATIAVGFSIVIIVFLALLLEEPMFSSFF